MEEQQHERAAGEEAAQTQIVRGTMLQAEGGVVQPLGSALCAGNGRTGPPGTSWLTVSRALIFIL